MESTIRAGWIVFGALLGLLGAIVFSYFFDLKIDGNLPIIDLAQLVAALFLAMYIPLAVERLRDRQRYSRDLLVTQLQDMLEGVASINKVIAECAGSGVTDDRNRMHIRARFITCNIKIGRFDLRLTKQCGGDCKDVLADFRKAYDSYYNAVTGGSLYGTGRIDWAFWRTQEFCFVRLQNSGIDLVRFLGER